MSTLLFSAGDSSDCSQGKAENGPATGAFRFNPDAASMASDDGAAQRQTQAGSRRFDAMQSLQRLEHGVLIAITTPSSRWDRLLASKRLEYAGEPGLRSVLWRPLGYDGGLWVMMAAANGTQIRHGNGARAGASAIAPHSKPRESFPDNPVLLSCQSGGSSANWSVEITRPGAEIVKLSKVDRFTGSHRKLNDFYYFQYCITEKRDLAGR